MAVDVSLLSDYAWSDIAKAAKMAMMNAALGGANYSINGRSFGRITIEQATKLYETAIAMAEEEANAGYGKNALAQFGEII